MIGTIYISVAEYEVHKDLLKYAIEYDRKSCVKVLKSIKKKINEINQLMNLDNCTPIIDLFLNG